MDQGNVTPSSSELSNAPDTTSSMQPPALGRLSESSEEPEAKQDANRDANQQPDAEHEPARQPEATDAPFVADGTKVDMDDALAKARAIAAKLGSIQPAPAPAPPADEPATLPSPPRYSRRSASPERRRSAKRSRSPDRSRHESRPRRFEDPPMRSILAFPVPTQLSGLIIGRNGNNLRAIEQRHGVRIQFDPHADKRSAERQITIEGAAKNMESARADIMDFVERHGKEQDGGANSIMVPNSKVGLIIGRGGESIREIQFTSGASVQVQQDMGRGEREIVLTGAPDQVERARQRIQDIVDMDDSREPREPRGFSQSFQHQPPHQPMGGQPMGGQPMGGQPMGRQHVEEMQIPSEAVGIIIGRGGETIKFLQQSTGTRIQVLQGPQFTGPMRPVTVSGDYNACMQAKQMIEEKRPAQFSGSGGYDMPQRGGRSYGQPSYSGYNGNPEPRQWGQQQQPYYAQQQPQTPQYGSYQGYQQQPQQQQQQQSADQTQWTNQQAADYYTQYASGNPEYAQYADYYRKLAEKDPNGIVPSGN
ncbi:hypothetical protein H4S01_000186 [Coemansia sp. RSA 2610]|nr:hypothetical protein H4S01_000186 [Coemansia sp. RSA 2610]